MEKSLIFCAFIFMYLKLEMFSSTLDEYNSEYNKYEEKTVDTEQKDETPEQDETKAAKKEETSNDEESKMVMEDMDTQTSTELVQNDPHDPDTIKHKGCELFEVLWGDLCRNIKRYFRRVL